MPKIKGEEKQKEGARLKMRCWGLFRALKWHRRLIEYWRQQQQQPEVNGEEKHETKNQDEKKESRIANPVLVQDQCGWSCRLVLVKLVNCVGLQQLSDFFSVKATSEITNQNN